MKKRIYISGKISGCEISEATMKFKKSELLLEQMGYEVVNPLYLNHDHDKSWESYMKVCIKALCDCDCIFMLNDWKESKGATIERRIAMELGMEVLYEKDIKTIMNEEK